MSIYEHIEIYNWGTFDEKIWTLHPNGKNSLLTGANGSGKTTLLEILTDRLKADKGEIEIGQTVNLGYYDQESRALNGEQRVIDYIKEIAEYVTTVDGNQITASQMLEKFLFPRATQYSIVGNLSGGEKRRLYLLRILMASPNVLLLDEPTNDLDIPTLIALEEYLDDFAGALIVVSHDRYFLDRTVDSIFRFEEGGHIREFAGDYSAYLETIENEEADKRAETSIPKNNSKVDATAKNQPKSNKLSFKEKHQLETLEKQIPETEKRLAEIEAEMVQFATDAFKLNDLIDEQSRLSSSLEEYLERWTELAERADA